VITNLAGKDATEKFNQFHDAKKVLAKFGEALCVGVVESVSSTSAVAPIAADNSFG